MARSIGSVLLLLQDVHRQLESQQHGAPERYPPHTQLMRRKQREIACVSLCKGGLGDGVGGWDGLGRVVSGWVGMGVC